MSYTILPATPQHLPYLASIEDAAGELFPVEDLPEPLRSISLLPVDFENALNENLLWVVVESNLPIAFLLARIIDGCIHIAEFDVHPDHGRRGIGSQLLNYVLTVAKQRAFQAVTLTTFEHLPWNAPFYSKHGFEVIEADKIGDELAQIVKKEKALGMRRRVAMKIKL
jgi:GNAT superfamily N-acetyltransferase